jgi:hypothetical protein
VRKEEDMMNKKRRGVGGVVCEKGTTLSESVEI